ncbi:MAG: Transglutaminase, partial [Halothiobacillaceae bacterium]
TQSDEIAFRVKFNGALPANAQRYWRGPVFWYTDGQQWLPSAPYQPIHATPPPALQVEKGHTFDYTVTLDPPFNRSMYALDLPIILPADAELTHDFQLLARDSIVNPLRYQVTSATRYRVETLSAEERQRALQLPTTNPRTTALGQQLQAQYSTPAAIVAAALDLFHTQAYIYTLTPPRLESAHPFDQFLFETRRGFCEHYAASFTALMRAAAIPARVVTGYQGGEINPLGNYLIVRQRDAHAWSEAPVRFLLSHDNPITRFIAQGRQRWDWLNHRWTEWVINYDQQRQNSLLEWVGLQVDDLFEQAMLLVLALALTVLTIAAVMLVRRRHRLAPLPSLWQKYCKKLERCGIKRYPYEGPHDLLQRVLRLRPNLAEPATAITEIYIALQYGCPVAQSAQLKQLQLAITRFKPYQKPRYL